MNAFFHSLPESEKERIESLEAFDEFEEFELKCSHYMLLIAVSSSQSDLMDKVGICSMETLDSVGKNDCYLEPIKLSPGSLNISRYSCFLLITQCSACASKRLRVCLYHCYLACLYIFMCITTSHSSAFITVSRSSAKLHVGFLIRLELLAGYIFARF